MTRLLPFLLLSFGVPARAAPVSPADAEFFEKSVRPVLADNCWSCHGPKKQTAGLRLDSRAAILKGGESGPAVNEKEPEKSLFLSAIRQSGMLKMPPKTKLSIPAIEALTHWVKVGAPWPEAATQVDAPDWRKHWAFQPISDPVLPVTADDQWSRSSIDRLIWTKLRDKGLRPSVEAERRVLIRRVTFDLTGLPPTPEEIDHFVADKSSSAFDRLVARLLRSPAFGEHWGRFWLDVARYADTKGYVFFEENNYPWAYTYRDYVIESFNADKPYDRFLLEQLAADRLVSDDRRPFRALGFLTVGGRFMNNTHDIIDDRIDVVTRGLMGLTVTCARCHDHKFDPVPSRDYYALYGVFASCDEPTVQPLYEPPPNTEAYEKFANEMAARERKLREFVQKKKAELAAGSRKRAAEYLIAAHANRNKPAQDDFMLIADGTDLNPKMAIRWQSFLSRMGKSANPIFTAWRRYAELPEGDFAEWAAAVPLGDVHPTVRRAFALPPRSMNDVAVRYARLLNRAHDRVNATVLAGGPCVCGDLDDAELRAVVRDPDYPPNVTVGDYGDLDLLPDRPSQEELKKLRSEVEKWRATGPGAPPRAMALTDSAIPVTPRVFLRGNPHNLGPAVPRQFLECLSGSDRKPFADGSGRLELARAITDPKNPLTARVFVNRVWQQLFGRGIVGTAGDFGLRGDPPSHPELLDHLAATFVADGWSVKRLVRRIVLSAAYRQRSDDRADAAKVDPDNALLWRMSRRRLAFESMRDAFVAASGKLDRTVGGPSVQNFLAVNANRRTLYAHLDRLNVPGVYRTFDYPSPDATSPRRDQTTVPPQALFLMNHPFVAACAKDVVLRPDVAIVTDPMQKLDRVYAILYGRTPTEKERALAIEVLGTDPATAWPRLAHALLMTNEFLFVD
jgi:mono/diheme cytochrome c family protein